MKKLLLACVIAALAGCAATGHSFKKSDSPTDGKVLIYIFRTQSAVFSMGDVHISVDKTDVADLSINGYTSFYAQPGEHKLAWRWPILDIPLLSRKVEWPRTWQAGKTYYYRFGVTHEGAHTVKEALFELPEEAAVAQIGQTSYQPPKNIHELLKPSPPSAQ